MEAIEKSAGTERQEREVQLPLESQEAGARLDGHCREEYASLSREEMISQNIGLVPSLSLIHISPRRGRAPARRAARSAAC